MDQVIENYFIYNGKEYDAFKIHELHIEDISPALYEVVRVTEGVPLFLQQHMERLNKSSSKLNYSIVNIIYEITENIKKLININNLPSKNIKLLVYNLEKSKADYIMYFIKSSYPTIEQYKNGVHTVLYHSERNNPSVKLINTKFKSEITNLLEQSNAYEAILLNHDNCITEGSRSSLFFIKNNVIYTSPLNDVLPGITRTNIITLCNSLKINIIEKDIAEEELMNFDAIFMTGTSPKLLPISSVDDIRFASPTNPIVKLLINEFDVYILKYIESSK